MMREDTTARSMRLIVNGVDALKEFDRIEAEVVEELRRGRRKYLKEILVGRDLYEEFPGLLTEYMGIVDYRNHPPKDICRIPFRVVEGNAPPTLIYRSA